MQTTEILLIRHGETDWNTQKRLQGHLDIPLNPEGQRQAQALGDHLADLALDAVFSSDLQRARQTAEPLAVAHGLAVQIDVALRERCYGGMEGLCPEEIAQRFPQAYAALKAREPDVRYPPGVQAAETLREFATRTIGALQRILASAGHRRIAIVSHGGVLDCIYRHAENMALTQKRDFDVLNASINRLTWNGEKLQLIAWGDVGHLRGASLDEVDR